MIAKTTIIARAPAPSSETYLWAFAPIGLGSRYFLRQGNFLSETRILTEASLKTLVAHVGTMTDGRV